MYFDLMKVTLSVIDPLTFDINPLALDTDIHDFNNIVTLTSALLAMTKLISLHAETSVQSSKGTYMSSCKVISMNVCHLTFTERTPDRYLFKP